jgi:hypothetical protein
MYNATPGLMFLMQPTYPRHPPLISCKCIQKIEAESKRSAEQGSLVCNAVKRRKLLRQTPGPQKRRMLDREVYLRLYTGEVRRKRAF